MSLWTSDVTTGSPRVSVDKSAPCLHLRPTHSAALTPSYSSETLTSAVLSEPRNHQEDRRGELLPGSVQGSVLGSLQSWPALGLRGSF